MDPRERADAALARARARGAYVVTPEDAISPMDASATLQIPRVVVSSLDKRETDPEATMVVQHPLAQNQPTQSQPSPRPPFQHGHPQQQHQGYQQQAPTPQPRPRDPEPEQQPEGMVPTVKQPPKPRRTMSERMDGTL
ncbi:hypothetical protein [Actinocrispum wychmicini]|uniref:Uncharacterized protein n=1 Tax=Actinocrispum wychmicini TaxID=1213861 RepID=A0A4V2S8Y3_9PSEU|nr:hypothetical protein [Actinocrispum wychmicini]TCO65660.1 hypothetical protein EV192_1011452 [Actinocrispum wychmicini]